MNRFIYKNAGSVSRRPKEPTISRFVSPWDTSGWYSVLPDFNVGKKVYSNSDAAVASCDEKYKGADHIMTFNSAAEGFDDRQEVDFYVETDSVVTVFLDASEPLPEWAGDYKNTGDVAVLSDGAEYVALEKTFAASSQVHIPGLNGSGNHFFVTVRPSEPRGETPKLAPLPKIENTLGEYKKRTYKSYVCETFNASDALKKFAVSESVSLKSRENDARDKYASIDGTGFLHTKTVIDGEKVVCSALVEPIAPEGTYAVCAFVGKDGENVLGVFIDGGEIKAVTKSVAQKLSDVVYGRQYAVKTIYDKARGTCGVWLDCRLVASDLPSSGDVYEIGFYSTDGSINVDDLKIYDDTEVFVADESGETLTKDKFVASKNAAAKKAPVPFEARSSVALSSADGKGAGAVYKFPKISGVGAVETKVRPTNGGFAKISLISEDGESASVALYKNSLYVSDGAEWKQIYAGLTDWFYYPCDNFFLIKITFDTVGKTFDVWVDGACRAKGFALRSNGVYGVGYAVEEKTTLLIEKIRVYDDRDLCRGVIPNAPVFDVRDYGAVGDGVTLDTEAIQKAVNDAAYTGGTVLLSGGTFFSGEIKLRSDMTFFVAPDATVLGTQDHSKYPLREPKTSLCAHRQLGRGLLYGENVKNITVTGGGMLDGNGLYRFKMNDPVNDKRELDARPDIVYITYSNNITVENINFKSSAFWTVVPLSSGNVTLRNLYLDCMNTPNRDGIDPVDCHDMTVENCCVMAGDDGLCFKSSDPVGCYNIDVRNMMIQSLASGIKFGTDTYYCLKDAHVADCTVKNVNRCGVSLETVDGAAVENVVFERIDMTDVGAPVYVVVGARNRLPRGIDTVRKSYIDGVLFKDIRFENAYPFSYTKDIREVVVCGQSKDQLIENLSFENCRFVLAGGFETLPGAPTPIDAKYPEYDRHGLSAGYAFTVRYAKNFAARDCEIILEKPDVRPMTAEFDVEK